MDEQQPKEPPPFESFNCAAYHDLVGRAGRYAANWLAERRERLVRAEFETELED